jgi:hypothetical protein
MLLNFKSDNFTGISTIIPASFKVQNEKPSGVLNRILEDYQSCIEIPFEKRPDSLFSPFSSDPIDFTLKLPFSKLISSHFSEILDPYQGKTESSLLVIDVVYDSPPSSEKVLNLLGNLTSYKNYEISGIISAHGFFYSSVIRSNDQWKSFNEGKICSWLNLVWSFCTSSSYPVMLVLSNTGRTSPCFLSKIDLDAMQKFCKLQDSRIKVSFVESFNEGHRTRPSASSISSLSSNPNISVASAGGYSRAKAEDLYKDYTSEYLRRSQEYLKVPQEKAKHFDEAEEKPYKSDKNIRDLTAAKKSEGDKKEDTYEYIRTVQDYKVNNDLAPRARNFSSEPSSQSRSYREDLLYKQAKQDTSETERPSKPGILKTSSIDSRYGRMQSYSSISPLTSPKENISHTYREGFDEENTEKPYSILKNSWMTDRKEHSEKKVNFSDTVFQIDDSVKGQMPEIKFSNRGTTAKNPSPANRSYQIQPSKSSKTPDYKLDLRRDYQDSKSLSSYKSSELKPAVFLKEVDLKDSWTCPKCSNAIQSTSYECGSCRFINWDKFYSLKSKTAKTRGESIPARSEPVNDFSKTSRANFYESRGGRENWRGEGRGLDRYPSETVGRLTSRDFYYNR